MSGPNLGAAGNLAGKLFDKEDKEGLSTLFKIVIPSVCDMVFKSCEGIESEVEVQYLFEGGSLRPPRTVRGAQKVNKLSFGQGSSTSAVSGKSLFDWYLEVCDSSKALTKKSLSIYVTDSDGKSLSEWKVLNAWPCRWMAPLLTRDHSALTVDYITFAHEGIERKK